MILNKHSQGLVGYSMWLRASRQAVFVALIIMLSAMIGLATVALPLWFLVAGLFLPAFVVLAWIWPELGIVGVMALLCGIAPSWLVPQFPLAGGKMQASELAFFALLAVIAIRAASGDRVLGNGLRAYAWPIGLLLGLALLSSISAYLFFHNGIRDILYETRIFIYWMITPSVVLAIDSRPRLNRFLLALVCLGVLLAVMVCVQSFTGITLLSARSAAVQLSTANRVYSDVVRSSLAQGVYIILFSLFVILARYLLRISNIMASAPLVLILTAGLLATFGRGVWIAGAIGVLILGLLVGRKSIPKLLIGGCAFVLMAAAFLSVSRPNMFDALLERVTSIDTKVAEQDESLVWRRVEREYAYSKLLEYPLLGIGLGGEYQPIRDHRMVSEQKRYIHNSFLYLGLKLGMIAIVIPFWVCWLMFINGRVLMRKIKDPRYRAITAAAVSAFMLPNLTSFTQPEWMDHPGVAFMGIMIGLVGVLNNLYEEHQFNN